MKTKFFLLSIFLTLACYFARGQSAIDTSVILHNYAQSEPVLKQLINDEIEKQTFLNIDVIGKYSNLLYQVQENSFIQLALDNRESIHLNLEYFDLQFNSPEQEEEYQLQTTFAKFYPGQFLDFLAIKMDSKVPVTLELLKANHTHLLQGNFQESFDRTKASKPELTQKTSGGGSTIFINDVSLHHVRFPAARNNDDCECSWWHCTLSCMDIPYDFIEGLVFGVCGTACAAIVSPAGLTGIPEAVCLVCLGLASTAAIICGNSCAIDACSSGYACRPGSIKPESDPFCDGNGNRVIEVCDCDGQDWHNEIDECPPGTTCQGDGVCAPCTIREPLHQLEEVKEVELPDDGGGLNGDGDGRPGGDGERPEEESPDSGGFQDDDQQERAVYFCRTINVSANLQNESTPNANDGSISISPSGGYSPYTYQWSNDETGSAITGLSAGDYCVTVIDRRCCYTVKCYNLIEEACDGLEWEIDLHEEPACNVDDGQITVNSITGAVPPYNYQWSNGGDGQIISNLEIGFYTVTVTDYNGCTGIESLYLTGHPGYDPNLDNTVVTNACPDSPNSGAIDLVVESPSVIFSYHWSNDAFTEDISGLSAGNYSVTIIDQCGSEYSENFDVGILSLETAVTHTIDNFCQGAVLATAAGGVPPFQFTIQGPSGTSTIETSFETHLFDDLCQGNHTVSVKAADGCEISTTVNVCICPDIVYQDWVYDETENEYCRYYNIPASALCQEAEGVHCFTPIFGNQWYYNEDTDQFCRSVSCPDDAYCEEFTIYEQCFDPDYTEWEYNSSADQYCREATCTGYDFCEGLVINQCLGYEQGNCTFTNQDMCECEIIVNNEVILVETVEPEIAWDFDENEGECLKIFYCAGTEMAEYYLEPEEADDWEFDENDQTCYRVVVCSDEDDAEFEQENDNPDIHWDYDEWEEACIAYIECDDDSDELEVEGDTDIEWEFDRDNDVCIADVTCSFDGDVEEQWDFTTPPEGGDIVGAGLIDGEYRCIVDYDCGNGALTGTTGAGLADCSDNPNGAGCIYTCESYSNVFDCLPQCDGLVGSNPSRNIAGDRGLVTFSQDPVAYPNPFKDEINIANLPIEEKGVRVELLDSRGALIKKMRSFNHTHLSINTSHLAKGIYFIRMYNMDHTFMKTEKVIKLR